MIKLQAKFFLSLILFLATVNGFSQTKLTTSDFVDSIHSSKPLLLDVRTPKEFEGGSIGNAKNIDWNDRDGFEAYTNSLDKKKPIYLFCLSGGRSAKAADYLSEKGFKVFELQGGYLKYQHDQKTIPDSVNQSNDEISLSKFQQIVKSNPKVLIDFNAEWCAPCKEMRPFLDEINRDEQNGIHVVFIDADKNQGLLKVLKISGIPRLQFFNNGKLSWDHTGAIEKSELLEAIQDL